MRPARGAGWAPVAAGAGACSATFLSRVERGRQRALQGDRLGAPSHAPRRAGVGPGVPLASVSLSSRGAEDVPGPLPSLQPMIPAPIPASFAQQAAEHQRAHDLPTPRGTCMCAGVGTFPWTFLRCTNPLGGGEQAPPPGLTQPVSHVLTRHALTWGLVQEDADTPKGRTASC